MPLAVCWDCVLCRWLSWTDTVECHWRIADTVRRNSRWRFPPATHRRRITTGLVQNPAVHRNSSRADLRNDAPSWHTVADIKSMHNKTGQCMAISWSIHQWSVWVHEFTTVSMIWIHVVQLMVSHMYEWVSRWYNYAETCSECCQPISVECFSNVQLRY